MMTSNKRKINFLENRVIRPAVIDSDSDSSEENRSDVYSASEVVSDTDNEVLEEEGDAQNNSVNEWDAITDLTPELEACTLNESTFNIPIEDISPARLENKCRVVIADNFYSSIELAEELLSLKTRYCGTLRSNRRGLPEEIVSLKLKKGEIKGAMNKNGVKVIKWVDKRQLLMLSTLKEDEDVLVNTGKKNKKTNEDVKKPTCVLTYNNNKKGVDFSDQMSSYYSTLKKGLKWFRKVGMEYLFGMALVNAWITYNMKNDKKVSKKEFTEALMQSLTGKSICPDMLRWLRMAFVHELCADSAIFLQAMYGVFCTTASIMRVTEGGINPEGGECAHETEQLSPKNIGRKNQVKPKDNDHVLEMSAKRRNCAGCYDRLRKTLNSTQAKKKLRK
ncbi:putative piggybac transposable element-derived [Operophtera brumata]|uniref:Putative piggybac transposable element-derived n=1 Tax=Operophtera brumata TaxID=104452 RepID=A0A0L7L5K1_OPEBR|nr:putative piggybac transposable element-derived [Operophtera brumata]